MGAAVVAVEAFRVCGGRCSQKGRGREGVGGVGGDQGSRGEWRSREALDDLIGI